MKPKAFKAATTSLCLSLLFLAVYGTTNWLTSLRHDVGTFYFAWERRIPFVAWMIVPYMSIDLFFVAAPFLCKTETELRTLTRRIAFAILVAGICFLLFPLRFAFERPPVTGWLGTVFDSFRNFDKPHNLLPSLHITLRTILAAVYARHSKGVIRFVCHIWFSLVGLSTLLTYQHHLIDVIGGFVLATYCFYFFREEPTKLPVLINKRVGIFYLTGSLLVAVLAILLRPWGLILFWPAIALGIVASAYFRIGPGIYRKTNGRLPLSTKCVLGPCLLGQKISLAYYQRQCLPWDKILPGLWIGRKLTDAEAAQAVQSGVTAVLDLTAEFNEARPFLNISCLNIPILDLTSPTREQLKQMAQFIAQKPGGGLVYVHCKIGYSRSAGAIGAYLLVSGICSSLEEVLQVLRGSRPSIIVRPEIISALASLSLEKENNFSGEMSRDVC